MPDITTSAVFPPPRGKSGNPSGRPRASREATHEARRFVVEAIHCLVRVMRTSTQDAPRIAAAREILDRALGRAPQSVDFTVSKAINEMSAEELAELESRLTGHAAFAALDAPREHGDLLSAAEEEALGEPVTIDAGPLFGTGR